MTAQDTIRAPRHAVIPDIHHRVSYTALRGLEEFNPNFRYLGQLQQVAPFNESMEGKMPVFLMDYRMIEKVLHVNPYFIGVMDLEYVRKTLENEIRNKKFKYFCIELSQQMKAFTGHATSLLLVRVGETNTFKRLYFDPLAPHMYNDDGKRIENRDKLFEFINGLVFEPLEKQFDVHFEDLEYNNFIQQTTVPICTQLSILFVYYMVAGNMDSFEQYEHFLTHNTFQMIMEEDHDMDTFNDLESKHIGITTYIPDEIRELIKPETKVYARISNMMAGLQSETLYYLKRMDVIPPRPFVEDEDID